MKYNILMSRVVIVLINMITGVLKQQDYIISRTIPIYAFLYIEYLGSNTPCQNTSYYIEWAGIIILGLLISFSLCQLICLMSGRNCVPVSE